jgi:hypothetical protein
MTEATTLKGYDIDKVLELMMTPLAGGAFKKHPSKSYLTTISADYSRERLTKIFGLFGLGWGLKWDPANTRDWTTVSAKGKDRYHFALIQAEFWFKLGEEIISFPVTGYSENDNLGDAMEGARTNAVGAGAKQLLFQLHIYKGTNGQGGQR